MIQEFCHDFNKRKSVKTQTGKQKQLGEFENV